MSDGEYDGQRLGPKPTHMNSRSRKRVPGIYKHIINPWDLGIPVPPGWRKSWRATGQMMVKRIFELQDEVKALKERIAVYEEINASPSSPCSSSQDCNQHTEPEGCSDPEPDQETGSSA